MNYKELKIRVCGNKKETSGVEILLDKVELTGNESKDRLILQQFIDENKIKKSIMYDGNSIVSYDRIITEYTKILKKKEFNKMSDYFYEFLHLDCGSIAHYDKNGWLAEYPDLDALKYFFFHNEDGTDIVRTQPGWKTDVIRIAKDILKLTSGEIITEERKIEKKIEKDSKGNQLDFFALIA